MNKERYFRKLLKKAVLTLFSVSAATGLASTVEFNACNQTAKKDGTTTVRAVGMWNISPSGYFTRYTTTNGMNSLLGGALGGNTYYEFKTNTVANPSIFQMQRWNYPAFTRNKSLVTVPNKPDMISVASAYNPADKMIYGCFFTADKKGWELGKFDPETLTSNSTRETVGTLDRRFNSLTFSPSGKLYGIDQAGDLFVISTSDAKMTKIGSTGFTPSLDGGACTDSHTGELYWVAVTKDWSAICKVDTASGKAERIINLPYGEQLRGLHVHRPALADGVPSYAENVKIVFEGLSRAGKLSFTMPASLYGGAKASGDAKYTVKIAGTQVASGTARFGDQVKDIPVEAAADGVQLAEVIVSNDAGDGPSHKFNVYVGAGTPQPVDSVKAVYSGGCFNVSWKAVEGSADGCYVDPKEVTYTVTRTPDNVVVADKIKELSLIDSVSIPLDPVTYAYSVVASYGDKKSRAVASPGVRLGAIVPPYGNDFSNEEQISEFTILNANADSQTWTWVKGAMVLPAVRTMNMNDWLITPPLSLTAGHAYLLTLDAQGMYLNVKEKFEVRIGKEPKADAMTVKVLDPVEVLLESKPTQTLVIAPEDGMYYLGIHGISAAGSGALYIHDMQLGEALKLTAPQSVSDLKAVPFPDGTNRITVSFKAPSKSIDGKELSAITKIELLRGNTLIKTFDNPAKEASLSFVDSVAASGDQTYNVVPYNADGKGQGAIIGVYAGVNLPGTVKNLKVTETSTEGTVDISWDAPGVDQAGFAINDDLVTYDLYSVVSGTRDLIVRDLKERKYTHKASDAGAQQKFMQYGVIAKTVKGEGAAVASKLLPIGTSYKLPFVESFSYGGLSHIMGTEVLKGLPANVYWQQCTTGDINKFEASDGDNGFMAHYAKYVGQSGRLFTGKIKVEAQNPQLWFSVYCIGPSHSGKISAQICDGGEWKNVKTFTVNELADSVKGWYRAVVDLGAYKGKTVQIGFAGETAGFTHILLDDVRVFDAKKNDLALLDFAAPLTTEAGKEYSFSLDVENNGSDQSAAHDVEVRLNGEIVATAKGTSLAPGHSQKHDIRFMIPVGVPASNTLQASVKNASDENKDNDTHKPKTVNIVAGAFPAVKNLKALGYGDHVDVTWAEVAKKGAPVGHESFEKMTSWANTGSSWKFVDADNAPVTGITGLNLPNIGHNSKQSWWVMDNTLDSIAEEADFRAKTGHKFLASMALANAGQTDDWAISPRLTGGAQAIGFHARSFHGRYPETFEVLYSKGSTDTKDFVSLGKVENVPYAWTEYTYLLPEGAQYFAIRHYTKGGFMLYVDDVTFTSSESDGTPLDLLGYYVLADSRQLTEKPVGDCSYQVKGNASKVKVYPVFSQGLGASAETDVTSGAEMVALDNVKVMATGGEILLTGVAGMPVMISGATGVVIFDGHGEDEMRIPAPAGVYIVKIAGKTMKIRVG